MAEGGAIEGDEEPQRRASAPAEVRSRYVVHQVPYMSESEEDEPMIPVNVINKDDVIDLTATAEDTTRHADTSDPNALASCFTCIICTSYMVDAHTDNTGSSYCKQCIMTWAEQCQQRESGKYVSPVTGEEMDIKALKLYKNYSLQGAIDAFTSRNLVVTVKRKAEEQPEVEDPAAGDDNDDEPRPAISPLSPPLLRRGARARRPPAPHTHR